MMNGPSAEIWCATHRGPQPDMVRAARATGYPVKFIEGISDTALARNITLTRAHRTCEADVVLMLDDDMTFDPRYAHKLVELAVRYSCPVSGLYLLRDGRAAATPLVPSPDWARARWLTGLGCLAIPRVNLARLALRSVECQGDAQSEQDQTVIAFCWSGPSTLSRSSVDVRGSETPRWRPEDYCLTGNLGGVILAPVPFGHLKFFAVQPDESSLARLLEFGDFKPGAPHEKTSKENEVPTESHAQ